MYVCGFRMVKLFIFVVTFYPNNRILSIDFKYYLIKIKIKSK